MKGQAFMFTGVHSPWHWGVTQKTLKGVDELAVRYYPGFHLGMVAFDSGPIRPSPEELKLGWISCGDIMVSPPLRPGLEIPSCEYSEWFIVDSSPEAFPELHAFVNYDGMNLATPEEIYATFDPSWERSGQDWLIPIQERFWNQLEALNPRAYVMSGGKDIVVSTQPEFLELCMKS